MKTDVENNEWKAEAPYMAGLQKENPFLVPEQYFNLLPDLINSSVYYETLKDTLPLSGFSVPDQYFIAAQERIFKATAGLTEEGQDNDEDMTYTLPKADGYSIPDLYFEKLQARILEKTVAQDTPAKKPARIVRLWRSGLLKYASAACFVLVTTFGLYTNHQNMIKESSDAANEQMLYDINEQEIIDNIQGTSDSVQGTNTIEEQKSNTANTDLETYILNNFSQNDLSSAL